MSRESFSGTESLRQDHPVEAYSQLVCGYLSLSVCTTEQSK